MLAWEAQTTGEVILSHCCSSRYSAFCYAAPVCPNMLMPLLYTHMYVESAKYWYFSSSNLFHTYLVHGKVGIGFILKFWSLVKAINWNILCKDTKSLCCSPIPIVMLLIIILSLLFVYIINIVVYFNGLSRGDFIELNYAHYVVDENIGEDWKYHNG
mgnify:CR=1 FL=1